MSLVSIIHIWHLIHECDIRFSRAIMTALTITTTTTTTIFSGDNNNNNAIEKLLHAIVLAIHTVVCAMFTQALYFSLRLRFIRLKSEWQMWNYFEFSDRWYATSVYLLFHEFMHIKSVDWAGFGFSKNYTHTWHDVINIIIVVIITQLTNEWKWALFRINDDSEQKKKREKKYKILKETYYNETDHVPFSLDTHWHQNNNNKN